MKKIILFAIALAFSPLSYAYEKNSVDANIFSIQTLTPNHSNTLARGYVVLEVDEALAGPCTSLFLEPDDKTSISFILASKAKSDKVRVSYYSDVLSPWGNISVCAVYGLKIL